MLKVNIVNLNSKAGDTKVRRRVTALDHQAAAGINLKEVKEQIVSGMRKWNYKKHPSLL